MSQAEFYLAQAVAAEAAAETAALANVRERNLRSAAAWRDMAIRTTRGDALRAEREAATEAKRPG